jgi:hypothetical protein
MKRDEFVRAGDDRTSEDQDAVQLAALSGADIAVRHELFEDTEHVGGNGDGITPTSDASPPPSGTGPTPPDDAA